MITKLGRVVTYHAELQLISSITMSRVTKLIKIVIYCKELPTIKSHDPSMRWSCDVTGQIK